jgi:hypothetical protein
MIQSIQAVIVLIYVCTWNYSETLLQHFWKHSTIGYIRQQNVLKGWIRQYYFVNLY